MASVNVDLSVPQELIDMIIDHLHDDPPSLFACGLATKRWLPSSRYHLFSNVALHECNILSFSRLLDNPSNNITPMVRHLVLSALHPESELDFIEKIRGSITVLPLLPTITTHLLAITSLSLAQIDLTQCSPEILQNILSNLGSVEALELESITIHNVEGAAAIICAFPLLKSISVDHVYPKDNVPTIMIRRQRPSFLIGFINLCDSHNGGIPIMLMAWLVKPMPTIHSIRCLPLGIGTGIPLEIIASAGTLMREIKINLNLGVGSPHKYPFIDITKCAKLQSIRFHDIVMCKEFDAMNRIYVPTILDQVSSPFIEVLSFCFVFVGACTSWPAYFDWEGVTERLLSPQFANLKRVEVEWPISNHFQAADVESFFANGPFSPIMERGLIRLKP